MKQNIYRYLTAATTALCFGAQADQGLMSLSLSELNLPDFNEYSVPIVLTATRLQQHQADVPASVTILDENFIKQVAAQNLADLLRYVPGMVVGPDKNNNADAVHYHGGSAALPKNLQVLINGRSMYRAGLAAVSWYEMPVAIEDIKRIEVVRGPNSASYGSNAFQAVINILTKHPSDTYGTTVSMQGGNNGEENIYLKQGGHLGKGDYRVSFTQKRSDQFEVDNDERASRFIDVEHYYQASHLGEFESSLILSDSKKELDNRIEFQTNNSELEEQRIEVGTRWTKDISSKHQIKVSAYTTQYKQKQRVSVKGVPVPLLDDDLRALFQQNPYFIKGNEAAVSAFNEQKAVAKSAGNPALLVGYYLSLTNEQKSQLGFANIYATGQSAVIGDFLGAYDAVEGRSVSETNLTNRFVDRYTGSIDPSATVSGVVNSDLDEYRYDIEIQDTYIYSPKLTFVSGASFRRDEVRSDTFFAGYVKNDTSRVFASATWQATTKANLHLGVMAEQESDADFVFVPRAAVNYKLTPSQSLRMVYSESVRSPDLFEQAARWQVKVDNIEGASETNGDTFYQTQQAKVELDHQYIRSYEVGYYGRFNRINSELDIRIFEENLTDVFYQSLKLEDFETQQDITMKFQGIEWQYSLSPFDNTQLRWTGAYVDASTNINASQNPGRESVLLRVHAKNTHTLSWIQSWGRNTNSSVNYVVANKNDQLNTNRGSRLLLERIEAKAIHNIELARLGIELSANLQHDLTSDSYVWEEYVYQDETRFQLGLRLDF